MKRIFLGLTCALLVLSLPFVAEAIDDDSLVLYLPFDEGEGEAVEDLSGNENHGTVEGDVDWIKTGKMGAALSFNEIAQQGVVVVKASGSLAITESLTMEVWVYPESVGDYRNVRGQANPHTYYLSIHQGKPSVWMGTNGAGGGTWLSADSEIPLDEWSHVAAVRDFGDGELRFYLNGELDRKHTLAGEIVTSLTSDHWFGNRLDGAWPFGGRLDEFVIYNRALTEAEIQQDMSAILAVEPGVGKLTTTWGSIKE